MFSLLSQRVLGRLGNSDLCIFVCEMGIGYLDPSPFTPLPYLLHSVGTLNSHRHLWWRGGLVQWV